MKTVIIDGRYGGVLEKINGKWVWVRTNGGKDSLFPNLFHSRLYIARLALTTSDQVEIREE